MSTEKMTTNATEVFEKRLVSDNPGNGKNTRRLIRPDGIHDEADFVVVTNDPMRLSKGGAEKQLVIQPVSVVAIQKRERKLLNRLMWREEEDLYCYQPEDEPMFRAAMLDEHRDAFVVQSSEPGTEVPREKVEALFPHRKGIRQLVDAWLVWGVEESKESGGSNGRTGPVERSAIPESLFRHRRFSYTINQDNIAKYAHWLNGGHDYANTDDFEKFFNHKMHGHKLWGRLCRLWCYNDEINPISIHLDDESNYAAAGRQFLRGSMGVVVSPFQPGQQYLYVKGVRAFAYRFLRIPVKEFVERRGSAQSLLTHELNHLLTGNCPYNKFILEGLAECGTALYDQEYGTNWWDTIGEGKYKILHGSQNPGFNLGEGISSLNSLNTYQDILGRMGGVVLYELLGETHEERIANFQVLVELSKPIHVLDKDVSVLADQGYRSSPTLDEWLDQIEERLPYLNFKERLLAHPLFQPATDGEQIVWVETAKQSEDKAAWGFLGAYTFERNKECGRVEAAMYQNIQPQVENFQLDKPGKAEDIPVAIRLRLSSQRTVELAYKDGFLRLDPITISDALETAEPTDLVTPFSIDVELPDGSWKEIGTRFYVDDRDLDCWEYNDTKGDDRERIEQLRTAIKQKLN